AARSWRSVGDCWPERTTVATPNELRSSLLTDGMSALSGSLPRTPFTTRCTSTATRSGLTAVVNWTYTIDRLAVEAEVSPLVSMLGRLATASSIGLVTLASTVSGSAPGYVVVTSTAGKLTLGVIATPRLEYANAPTTH